jgi:hypothetical protein
VARVYDNSGLERWSGSALNPAPVISSLSPPHSYIEDGGSTLDVTIIGTGFIPESVARVDGISRTTSYINATTIVITLTAGDTNSINTLDITVLNPSPGGGQSSATTFQVRWDPSQVSTDVWLDAADSSTISIDTGVSEWTDKSANAFAYVQNDTAEQPLYVSAEQNGLNIVRFDGSDDSLSDNSTENRDLMRNIGYAVAFMVLKKIATDGSAQNRTSYVWSLGGGSARFSGFFSRTTANEITLRGCRLDAETSADVVAGVSFAETYGLVTFEYDYANGDGRVYLNASLENEDTSYGTSGNTSDTRGAGATMLGAFQTATGAFPTTTNHMDMDLGEFIVFNNTISSTVWDQLEGYLAWKWGLEGNLPGGHPYENAPP